MSDADDEDGMTPGERMAMRRMARLRRAMDQARDAEGAATPGGDGAETPPEDRAKARPSRARPKRNPRLPPPPAPEPGDLRALGLPVSPSLGTTPEGETQAEKGPLILGTGETRAVPPETPPKAKPPESKPADPAPDPDPGSAPRGIFAAPHPSFPPDPSPRPLSAGPPLLQLNGVYTDIGQYRILQGVDLAVPEGSVTMLLGRNGVGKTTTLRTVMGLWRARSGSIRLGAQEISGRRPTAVARAGVGFVPEDMGIFGDLTVEENMRLAAVGARLDGARLDWLTAAFPPLRTFWRHPAGNLSGGQKQMLALARAMVTPRRLYLIDEPTKGLAPAIVQTLISALRKLKEDGATILMVEQNFAVAAALGDHAAVMDDGRIEWTGTMAELAADADLQKRLMGLALERQA